MVPYCFCSPIVNMTTIIFPINVSFELSFQMGKNIKWQKSVKLDGCKSLLSELCLSLNKSRNIWFIFSRQKVLGKMTKLSGHIPSVILETMIVDTIITTES